MSAQSPFRTDRCRITGTTVTSGGAPNNFVRGNSFMTLFVHAWVDPAVKSQFGLWVVSYRLIGVPDPPGNRAGDHLAYNWLGLLKNLPTNASGFFNPNITWNPGQDATGGEGGWYLFHPRLLVRDFQAGREDFAYAEELHYIFLDVPD